MCTPDTLGIFPKNVPVGHRKILMSPGVSAGSHVCPRVRMCVSWIPGWEWGDAADLMGQISLWPLGDP